jgi:hypothetical protein
VESSAAVDIAVLNGAQSFVPVHEAGREGGPVASVRHGELGAVLWLSRCETCDDGTIAADITVYRHSEGEWMADGGGGGDWDWPLGHVPDDDADSGAFELGLERPGGRLLRLIPGYGPSGAALRAELAEPDASDGVRDE